MISQFASALLISDLHLTPSMPLTAQRFFDFCEKEGSGVEAVFILGDLFEYWIGDDAVSDSPFQKEVKAAIAKLSTKTKIYYMHGNRDFLIGADFLKKTGMTLLPDPTKILIANQEYILCHGDSLCTADAAYQIFRNWVRKSWLQKLFLNMPLRWRRSIAHHLRNNSTKQYPQTVHNTVDTVQDKSNVTLSGCAALLSNLSGERLIHGHTHRPAHHHESLHSQEWQRWVLSDWDLDHPESILPKASALRIDASGAHYIDLVKAH
jgi:UDP-2,3-diacylglucosamine hydrolase